MFDFLFLILFSKILMDSFVCPQLLHARRHLAFTLCLGNMHPLPPPLLALRLPPSRLHSPIPRPPVRFPALGRSTRLSPVRSFLLHHPATVLHPRLCRHHPDQPPQYDSRLPLLGNTLFRSRGLVSKGIETGKVQCGGLGGEDDDCDGVVWG